MSSLADNMHAGEVEPRLVGTEGSPELYGPGDPHGAEAAAITVEQGRVARALAESLQGNFAAFADRIVNALTQQESWQHFSLASGDGGNANGLQLVRFTDNFTSEPGAWKIKAITALARPGNSADLPVVLVDLIGGMDIQVTAKRVDPNRVALEVPVPIDGSFSVRLGGAPVAGDVVQLIVQVERVNAP